MSCGAALAACERAERGTAQSTTPDSPERATAEFQTVEGMKLQGEAKLEEVSGGVKVIAEVEKAPSGKKGIHIHEKGDCSNIAGQSMGSHFAPEGDPHGLPPTPQRHLGDLGNISIGPDGKGRVEIVVPGANLNAADRMSFAGKALVIHEGEDKGVQPTGGAGKPIACAVIKAG